VPTRALILQSMVLAKALGYNMAYCAKEEGVVEVGTTAETDRQYLVVFQGQRFSSNRILVQH